MVKSVTVVVNEEIHFQFKNKIEYNDLTIQDVMTKLIYVFATTKELDHYVKILDN